MSHASRPTHRNEAVGVIAALLLAAAMLSIPAAAFAAGEVNVYSARQEQLIKPLLDRFTAQTAIRVNLVTGKAEELLARLKSEGRNTRADLLLTVDAGNLYTAEEAGLFRKVDSRILEENIPLSYRDPDGEWFGLSLRARPFFYHPSRVDPADLSTYEALADPKWKGRICIRSSSNVYNQSMTASMIAAHDEAAAETWARGLVANFARPPAGGDRDQIKAVAAGQCDVAVANTYYYAQMLASDDANERNAAQALRVFWPNKDDRGTHVNISGAGVTTHAKNPENAVRLLEFLSSAEAQQWYAEANQEYPVREGIAWSTELQSLGDFKSDPLNVLVLGAGNARALMLMDRAGWK